MAYFKKIIKKAFTKNTLEIMLYLTRKEKVIKGEMLIRVII